MRAEQTCEIVRDLMPLLADGLVAPKTEAWMKEHLEECPECKEIWDALMAPEAITPNAPTEKQLNRKVNFMKKIRRTTAIKIIVIAAVICAFCFGGFYLLTQVKFYVPTKDMTVSATPSWKVDYQPVIIYAYDVTVDKKYGKATLEDESKQLIPDEEMGNIEEYSFRIYYTLWDYLFRANRETTLSIDIRGNYPDRASMVPDSKD
ncbi:MAG: zf-HC2 domain-containing protein, partial [Clostridiaceae bacterium]|nr:zf-HC2 domain-containing protein [Clostridiaceae bacterium]